MSDDRKAALDNALKKIEKNFGKGSIMRMGDKADTGFRPCQLARFRWMKRWGSAVPTWEDC